MKSAVLAVAACCIFAAAATPAAEPVAAPAVTVAPPAVATGVPAAPAPVSPLMPAPPVALIAPPSASAGGVLQTILALSFVLALLAALAWAMKRYGPRSSATNATLRMVGSLSLGGRERILIIEVADQWIVVGAAPGRVNALALMPRQSGTGSGSGTDSGATLVPGASGGNFSHWLKQTMDKRHGK